MWWDFIRPHQDAADAHALGARRRHVLHRRQAFLDEAKAAQAVGGQMTTLVVAARRTVAAAAIEVRLFPVLRAVAAGNRGAEARGAAPALAIRCPLAPQTILAGQARAAAVLVGFGPVLDVIRTGGNLAEAGRADRAPALHVGLTRDR